MIFKVPLSIGETMDKLSILKIKKSRISNSTKLLHIEKEFKILSEICDKFLLEEKPKQLYEELIKINEKLWTIEDEIRNMEKEKKFDNEFIQLARNVYFTNDERFRIKNELNFYFNSDLVEVKQYKEYN